jgi:ubiquitin-like modifier-activating enzyme ATG7
LKYKQCVHMLSCVAGYHSTLHSTQSRWASHPCHVLLLTPSLYAAMQDAEQLTQLVDCHDVIFLLTDTRESRWLPTLLAAAAGKVAITAALGFDNFVVMRHGLPMECAATTADAAAAGSSSGAAASVHAQLGCYFCNDVVAPLNSTMDRTLDQQCTVARPGLAPIAGALAVELMAAVLQHPLRGHAPAPTAAAGSSGGLDGALGPVPHMIRGQMFGFGQTCMVGQAFSQCTACSPVVLQQYRSHGWGFVQQVLSQPSLLEELTGLAELHRQAAAMAPTDSDDDDDGQEGEKAAGEGAQGSGEEEDWTEL